MKNLFHRWPWRSGPKHYENFDLRISKISTGYRAKVDVDERVAKADFGCPFAREELAVLLADIGVSWRDVRVAARPDIQKTIRRIGTELFRAIFKDKVEALWRECLSRAGEKGRGVRLRLRFEDDSELADWPWEYLCDPDDDFLATSLETPVVRYPELITPVHTLKVRGPLRILVVTANPRGSSPLDIKREMAELEAVLADLHKKRRVQLELLEHASLSRLAERLEETFHVMHFIGHGTFDHGQNCGVLLFETENGAEERVNAEKLSHVLKDSQLGLVVLNACEGARTSPENFFAGVAQSLVKSRIPAVVAMQFAISDAAAISFASRFYGALARWASVDRAVSEARKAMRHYAWEWGTPVLYLRSDGRIFGPHSVNVWPAALTILLPACLLISPQACEWIKGSQGCSTSNVLDMKFIRIKPGAFKMGSKPRDKDEIAHEVRISKPFCMGEHEVTRGQWKAVMKEEPGGEGADDLPVTEVSWDDIRIFLERLNEMEPGMGYRLSTEAEWEYAARAGSTRRFSFGEEPDLLSRYGNCEGDDSFDGLAPVKSFKPNSWGLYDMQGNASEWVEDWYGEYPSGAVTDPRGPMTGMEKVRRGGSFKILEENCDAVSRTRSKLDYRSNDVGFRLVRTPES